MSAKYCLECGVQLPATVAGGLCSRCALRGALASGKTDAPAPPLEAQGEPTDSQSPGKSSPPAGSAVASRPLSPADRIRYFGDYELLAEIARGGMGVVWKARQMSLGRVVALKMVLGGDFGRPEVVRRFRQEARAAARLQHPNIVEVHEVGEHEGQPYFSMDFVEGPNLAELVSSTPLPARRAARYVQLLAEAIDYAHGQGVLHRDLKPSNVLVDQFDQPRITDFGLAKSPQGEPDLTLSGQVLGTPNYLPPEQAAGRRAAVGPAGDVYGLGAVLYFLLTARAPFTGATLETVLDQVLHQEPVAPRLLNGSVLRDLETICLKCLEKEPARRYASAGALADDLGRFLRSESIRARPAGPAGKTWRWCQRRPVRAGLVAGLILAVALGTSGILWQWRRAEVARRVAEQAEGKAQERLWDSYLAQARAYRFSNRPGRRFESLAALSNAAAIRPSLELRNEAIACLALRDARVQRRFQFPAPVLMGDGLVFDANFLRYARTDPEGGIHVCRVKDDVEVMRLDGPREPEAISLTFSADGQLLAERFDGPQTNGVCVWSLVARKQVLADAVKAQDFHFTPDSRRLIVVEAGKTNPAIQVYGLLDRAESRRTVLPEPICDLAVEPTEGRLAISLSVSRTVAILEPDSLEIQRTLQLPGIVRGLAWSPNGGRLAGCCDGQIYLWDMRRPDATPTILEGHKSVAKGVLFNRRGNMLASWGWDGMTRFWDPYLGRQLVSLPGAWAPGTFGPGDRRLGFSVTHTDLGIWEVEPADECLRLGAAGNLSGWEGHGQFSPDGRLLAVAGPEGYRLLQVSPARLLAELPASEYGVALFTRDGQSLILAGATGVEQWPLKMAVSGTPSRGGSPRRLWAQSVHWACLSPDGEHLFATSTPGADVLALDLQRPESFQRLQGHPRATCVTACSNGRWLATGTWKGQDVRIWELPGGRPIKELPVVGSAVCAFSPDGRWLVTGSAEEYVFWRTGSWERVRALLREGAGDMSGNIAFAPDSSLVALLHDRGSDVKLVAVADGRELASLDTGKPLGFSPDGSLLATAGLDERTLLVWDLGRIRRSLAAMNLNWDLPAPQASPEILVPDASSLTGTTNSPSATLR